MSVRWVLVTMILVVVMAVGVGVVVVIKTVRVMCMWGQMGWRVKREALVVRVWLCGVRLLVLVGCEGSSSSRDSD
jgi:hypothetical protein